MCEILYTFLCSVFTDEDVNKLQEPKRIFLDDDSNKLCNFVITKDKDYNKLCQLKENKAPGTDRLSSKLLKEIKWKLVSHFVQYLTDLYTIVVYPRTEK